MPHYGQVHDLTSDEDPNEDVTTHELGGQFAQSR